MTALPTRRTAIAMTGAGIAGLGLSLLAPQMTLAAMSSAAGIVGGGSLEGTAGAIHFSAFGSRMSFDDAAEPTLLGSLNWLDPVGLDGEPVVFQLVSMTSYGPTEAENERMLTGTVSANGEGEHPFALVLTDWGHIASETEPDHAWMMVGEASGQVSGTPVADTGVAYEYAGVLLSGDLQIVTLA